VNHRKLGRTGLEVSEVGYGAWGIGQTLWVGADDDESLRALNRAVDLGVTLIDTRSATATGTARSSSARSCARGPSACWWRRRSRPRT
jgi:predicted aldo/keto reductase-like oxidoreductase